MKYHEIISVLTEQPLLITPAAHASLLRLFNEHMTLSAAEFAAKREGVDFCGNAVELDGMEVDDDGVATIPVGGPIGRGLGKFEKGAGAVDTMDIWRELDEAEADKKVKGIILDFDSPGGMVNGTPELADRILRVEKPIVAFAGGMMASAAYWLGSATDQIFATRSADVGSVGVYAMILDTSKAAEARGVKVDVISSGKYKGMGTPGTSLTEEQRDLMKNRVRIIADQFKSHVQQVRPDVSDGDMEGQSFFGVDALNHGFIDDIVSSRADVAALLR